MDFVEFLTPSLPALSVGAISADLMCLEKDIGLLEDNHAPLLHFDVMDGRFVPQLTFGPWFVKAVKTTMLKDVHLMIENPHDAVAAYAAAGADCITLHVESCPHVLAALQKIAAQKNANDATRSIGRGIAINPSTPLCMLEPLLGEIDMLTLVCINPGFAGQTMRSDTSARAAQARELIARAGKKILFCIDGGVTQSNIDLVGGLGADIVVSGSAVFEKSAVAHNLEFMQKALKRNLRP
jgi:ribulose-phosphate 3-epimerase